MKLNDKQLEFYGAEIYRYYLGFTEYKLIPHESPDFILCKENKEIGVEIVRPSEKEENQLIRILNNDITNNKKINYYKSKGKIKDNIYSIDMLKSERLIDFINNKTKKLNSNYSLFKKNVLCCIPIACYIGKTEIDIIISNLNSFIDNYLMTFDEVVIIKYDELFVFKKENVNYSYKKIDIEETFSHTLQEKCSKIEKK